MTAKAKLLVTGAGGLIGSEIVTYFSGQGYDVVGIDNNMRQDFFGPAGDTSWNIARLESQIPGFTNLAIDIRDLPALEKLFGEVTFDAICHAAAQPSHDLAATRPFDDFHTNATGTLNLLELTRRHCPEAHFAFLSTNKVYGDAPNFLKLRELATRFDYADEEYQAGIPETFPIDNSTHSIFGASKVAADIMVQEYGKYFGMKTIAYRGGCLTGPHHSGVALHGFLNFLIKTNVRREKYTVLGYKGKQVRDNIHAFDVARAIHLFFESDNCRGEVYNLGGGRGNSCSILEAFEIVEQFSGQKMDYDYSEQNRVGDHVCYISDLSKLRRDFPGWDVTKSLEDIFQETVAAYRQR